MCYRFPYIGADLREPALVRQSANTARPRILAGVSRDEPVYLQTRHRNCISRSGQTSDVVLEASLGFKVPRGQILMALASDLASKVKFLALRAALTIFWHCCQTQGLTTTAKVRLKDCRGM